MLNLRLNGAARLLHRVLYPQGRIKAEVVVGREGQVQLHALVLQVRKVLGDEGDGAVGPSEGRWHLEVLRLHEEGGEVQAQAPVPPIGAQANLPAVDPLRVEGQQLLGGGAPGVPTAGLEALRIGDEGHDVVVQAVLHRHAGGEDALVQFGVDAQGLKIGRVQLGAGRRRENHDVGVGIVGADQGRLVVLIVKLLLLLGPTPAQGEGQLVGEMKVPLGVQGEGKDVVLLQAVRQKQVAEGQGEHVREVRVVPFIEVEQASHQIQPVVHQAVGELHLLGKLSVVAVIGDGEPAHRAGAVKEVDDEFLRQAAVGGDELQGAKGGLPTEIGSDRPALHVVAEPFAAVQLLQGAVGAGGANGHPRVAIVPVAGDAVVLRALEHRQVLEGVEHDQVVVADGLEGEVPKHRL